MFVFLTSISVILFQFIGWFLKMPRPGPRPYECVKRSWHNDRNQPIRGSIIQQIFRVVYGNSSTLTKKNREWQAKLPLVVIKSEEILYSKANSEDEYVDPETLWDRVNDAIDTIIRKDDIMEGGEFLPPCVEAALNLVCVPGRTSRSQRNSNNKSYLSAQNQHPAPKNARNLNIPKHERPNTVNQSYKSLVTNRGVRQNNQIAPPRPSFYPPKIQNFPKQTVSIESKSRFAPSVYPLYYGVHFQPRDQRAVFHTTHQDSSTIIVGTPVFQTVQSFNSLKNTIDDHPQPPLVECDLSLRLGLVSSGERGLTHVNNVDSGQNKEFSFFPLISEGEQVHNLVTDVRKRKAAPVINNVVNDGQRFLQLEPDFNQKRRGL